MSNKPRLSPFWKEFLKGVECRSNESNVIKGASGLEHQALCIGIDGARKRIIFVSDDTNARAAVLARGDVQAALDSFHVIFARIIPINLVNNALNLLVPHLNNALDDKSADGLVQNISGIIANIIKKGTDNFKELNKFGILANEGLEKAKFGLETLSEAMGKLPKHKSWSEAPDPAAIFLENLRKYDPLAEDLKYGICPLPLYGFSREQFELISKGNTQTVQEILRKYDIFQYFFPAPDHLALGLIEHKIFDKKTLLSELKRTPNEGHPYAKPEITDARSLLKIIDELQEKNLIVEGNLSYELSEKGAVLRQEVKYKPREGLISKIVNRFKINIDLKTIFGIGQ